MKAAAAAAAASASATSAAAARHGMTGAHSASTWSGAAWPGANARAESTADPARAHGARVWTNGAAEALTSDGDGVSLSRALAPLNASAPSRQLDRPGVRPGSSFSAHAPRSEPSAALLAAGAQQPQPLASSPFSRDRHRHAQPLSRGAQPYIGLDAASSGAVAAPGVDAALLLRAGASAGLPARLARLVFSGAPRCARARVRTPLGSPPRVFYDHRALTVTCVRPHRPALRTARRRALPTVGGRALGGRRFALAQRRRLARLLVGVARPRRAPVGARRAERGARRTA